MDDHLKIDKYNAKQHSVSRFIDYEDCNIVEYELKGACC